MQATSRRAQVASWSSLQDRVPIYARAGAVDLVAARHDPNVSVLYGRCLNRGVAYAGVGGGM